MVVPITNIVKNSILATDNIADLIIGTSLLNITINIYFVLPYYDGIMLNAFNDLLCSKLCWHNRWIPNHMCNILQNIAKLKEMVMYTS